MTQPWNEGVRGTQVPELINSNAATIRCVAGPGSGKTFGLVRRVERILHPDGLGVNGRQVLVVAFNRVIARQLREDIQQRLTGFPHTHDPVICTIHALCAEVMREDMRMLLPHEVEAMIYDIINEYPAVAASYDGFDTTKQALLQHEAGHADHPLVWRAARQWLTRHRAHLVSDLPRHLLDRLKGGDFPEQAYAHVIVDEFQDLTSGEQQLMFRLRSLGGQLVALGDPRQSIYAFRGNDPKGLAKLETLIDDGGLVTDVAITECQRCPKSIVLAANQLMVLSGVDEMVPTSEVTANTHVVTWKTPSDEASGMAKAIVMNIHAHPNDRHLAMVTRRQFGYRLREEMAKLDSSLRLELGFSESLLEEWAPREAFLIFCLLLDPDPPTWRAWLGYKNSITGKGFKAPSRNSNAYLSLLKRATDSIDESVVEALAKEPRETPRGEGGSIMWDRAKRFVDLRGKFRQDNDNPVGFIDNLFDRKHWFEAGYATDKVETAALDLALLRENILTLFNSQRERGTEEKSIELLRRVAQQLRHQIATNESSASEERGALEGGLQVATLWGAKGMTAEHVYILGVCKEALPGQRRDNYPGTEVEYFDEQRRLFYVSITRPKETLVISRALHVARSEASKLGLIVTIGNKHWAALQMSPFLRDIIGFLPVAVQGVSWGGCGPE
jgi:DNA helicase II / ATP-dependent DNA helicase PcrA